MEKKIVHFHPSSRMAAIFVQPLVDFEINNGCNSTIVTSNKTTQFDRVSIPYDLKLKNMLFLPYAFIKLCFFLYVYKPNIVISHNSRSALLPILAARLLGIERCIYFNHGVPSIFYKGLLGFAMECIEAVILRFSSEVITVSDDMKKELARLNPNATISLIGAGSASGINLDLFKATRNKKDFNAKFGFSNDDFLVVYVARPEDRKGFSVVLYLWEKYFRNSHYKLILCGPSEVDVKSRIDKVPKNIIPLGFTDNVPEILVNANCLILPSLHEGLSYAVLEAMASGCLPIANDIPGISELITDGSDGFLIPKNEIEAYARVILLLENLPRDELFQMKRACINKSKKYSRDIFLESYYKKLLSIFDAN
jgi:glycosyltransferase involved in cell wall biosynthesis